MVRKVHSGASHLLSLSCIVLHIGKVMVTASVTAMNTPSATALVVVFHDTQKSFTFSVFSFPAAGILMYVVLLSFVHIFIGHPK